MTSFAIAGVQLNASSADNIDAMARQIGIIARRFPWVDMIMFGELCALGANPRAAETLPGPVEERFCALARKHRVWLLPGSLYELKDGKIYNTAPVIDPHGKVVARYRKMYPFLPYERDIEAGREFVTFEIPNVAVFGVSICYDAWFPETTRTLVWQGAEIILHPSLTNTLDRDAELAIARASAAQNQCYFVDINSAGELAFGRSIVVGPEGDVIHLAGAGQEIIPVRVDLQRVRRTRAEGLHGLGQPLKSFRDGPADFPPYVQGPERSTMLRELGPLEKPGRSSVEDAAQ